MTGAEILDMWKKSPGITSKGSLDALVKLIDSKIETLQKERDEARAELASRKSAGKKYIEMTDPLISCVSHLHGGEKEKPCGTCRICVIDKADRYRKALEEYGMHKESCRLSRLPVTGAICDCGFEEALKGEES